MNDAITFNRPYKFGWNLAESLREMAELSAPIEYWPPGVRRKNLDRFTARSDRRVCAKRDRENCEQVASRQMPVRGA